ncbi:MAG: asparagine synthase (glutamine-hydrolyzing) [Pirellula sp.]|jgi:asparagine synthase (glutamine-hydrolysing)
MCGIAGYFQVDCNHAVRPNLRAALDSIAHRGPDDEGIFENPLVGLGHRRLSIIDLSPAGRQPMTSSDGRFVVVFNGEIYNYRELRAKLTQSGYTFRGDSDTEVLVNGFQHWGNAILKELNGIFAFAIWDNEKKALLLARDRMGVKPLYYQFSEGLFKFGSEIKALIEQGGFRAKLEPQGFHEFLYYGNPLGETTMFVGVKRLLPGCWLEVSAQGAGTEAYWKLEDIDRQCSRSIDEATAVSESRRLLEEAVARQLVSDVPVGVFLSGGIDSSAISAFAVRHYSGKLRSYSAGFDFGDQKSELPLAAKVAKALNTEHHEIMIRGSNLQEVIVDLVRHHDEPFCDAANIPLYLMTREIKSQCKVILQGDGGDELFGGYNRYRIMQQRVRYQMVFSLLNQFLPIVRSRRRYDQIKRFHSIFSEKDPGLRLAKFLTVEVDGTNSPAKILSNRFAQLLKGTNPFKRYQQVANRFDFLEDEVQRLFWVDNCIILPDQFLEKVDKSTMANGVEVRVPFLDNNLVEFALGLPAGLKMKHGTQKHLLKKALRSIVPDEVLFGPKLGFGVPYQNWIKGPLRGFMLDVFHSRAVRELDIFDIENLSQRIEEHTSGAANWGFLLWKMLNFCIWVQEYNVDLNFPSVPA